jgi:MFS family permease
MKTLPRTVWALGFVSMCMDISSEMIHSLLPVFLVSVLQATTFSVGLIEGAAEAVALFTKVFSGILSDRLGRRKRFLFTGYGLGAATKPLFAMAAGVPLVFAARLLDRMGKGIRGAPRDALVADVTPPHLLGTAYGLRQSLDTVGAFIGPLLAMALMLITSGKFRLVFWIAVIPGMLAVVIILLGVREPARPQPAAARQSIRLSRHTRLGAAYWGVLLLGTVFTMARFSEAFLLLRARDMGLQTDLVPLVLVIMNVAYALAAYPAGRLSDRMGRGGLMAAGLLLLIAADIVLALAQNNWYVGLGAVLWGLHMGFTQGLLSAMVADSTGREDSGTAFGIFGLACGLALLAANLIAGFLWSSYGPRMTFWISGAFAAVALMGYVMVTFIGSHLQN